jgi:hypothetical protein
MDLLEEQTESLYALACGKGVVDPASEKSVLIVAPWRCDPFLRALVTQLEELE